MGRMPEPFCVSCPLVKWAGQMAMLIIAFQPAAKPAITRLQGYSPILRRGLPNCIRQVSKRPGLLCSSIVLLSRGFFANAS